jgi:hypothetical protein
MGWVVVVVVVVGRLLVGPAVVVVVVLLLRRLEMLMDLGSERGDVEGCVLGGLWGAWGRPLGNAADGEE